MHLANSDTIIHVIRYPYTGLCYIKLNPQYSPPASRPYPVTYAANSAYSMTTKRDLVQYMHCVAFRPAAITWTKEIGAGYFATLPGLTSELVCKQHPLSISTTKVHLRQDRQNIRFTKPVLPTFIPETAALS